MPASFDFTLDDPSTWTMTGSAPKQKVLDTVEDAGRYLYPIRYQKYEEVEGEQVPILYGDLTLIQKKGIIVQEFMYSMLQFADTYNKVTAIDTARDAAAAETEDKYGLG